MDIIYEMNTSQIQQILLRAGWYIGPWLIAYEFCVSYWTGNVFAIWIVELYSNCYDNLHTWNRDS